LRVSSGHTAQSRAWDEKQDGKSAPSPDHQDTRAHLKKPRNHAGSVVRQGTRTTPGQTPPLALEKDILGAFVADLCRAGVAGEEQLAQLEYLAITSRVLPWGRAGERPISVLAKGTSSTGKSFTTSTVLRFFPAEAWLDLGSMSRRLLFYTEEVFAHRFLIVPEWASIKDDEEVVAMLRVLLSEGRLVHGTVEGEGRRKARRIVKEGPTGLIVTTTESSVDVEMETRCLSLTTDDTPEQTRRVFAATAAGSSPVTSWISTAGTTYSAGSAITASRESSSPSLPPSSSSCRRAPPACDATSCRCSASSARTRSSIRRSAGETRLAASSRRSTATTAPCGSSSAT